MKGSHHSGIATALVLLALFLILFWDKLSQVITTTVAGQTVPDAAKSLSVAQMVQVPLVPDNVPIVRPYNPGPVPVIFGNPGGSGSDIFAPHIITGPVTISSGRQLLA